MSLLDFPPSEIPLKNGGIALVDRADSERLGLVEWRQVNIGTHAYARRDVAGAPVLMHRELMGLSAGDCRVVDHIDGNGLNNTRRNLRVCTPTENVRNRRRTSNRTGYKGVSERDGQYVARIGDRHKYLGSFPSKHMAAAAYNAAARELFGAFAALNHIDMAGYRADVLALIEQQRSKIVELEQLLRSIES